MVRSRAITHDWKSIAYRANRIATSATDLALNLFFPPRCIICRCAGTALCPDCIAETPLPFTPLLPLQYITASRAAFAHTGAVRAGIHALKYENHAALAQPLAQALITLYRDLDWPCDCVTCVPMHEARLQQRHYNHAMLIAARVAAGLNLPFLPDMLEKTRESRQQVGLNSEERRANVNGTFSARADLTRDRRVLLIDDVRTTGATLSACAAALLDREASAVFTLTLTVASWQRADRHSDSADF